jgi:hypothetical protein
MSLRHYGLIVAVFPLLMSVAPARGQYQVDNQIGPVDNRVNGELYGNDRQPLRQPGYQVRLLPSEERYAIWRSGVLPSELRLARESAGPLTPNGVIDYLPRRSPLQQAARMPEPRLYNPAELSPEAGEARLASQGFGPLRGYPQTLQQGLMATTRVPGALPAGKPIQQQLPPHAIPSLIPGTDRPLPIGRLYDDVRYEPNHTLGGIIFSRPATQPSLSEKQPNPR